MCFCVLFRLIKDTGQSTWRHLEEDLRELLWSAWHWRRTPLHREHGEGDETPSRRFEHWRHFPTWKSEFALKTRLCGKDLFYIPNWSQNSGFVDLRMVRVFDNAFLSLFTCWQNASGPNLVLVRRNLFLCSGQKPFGPLPRNRRLVRLIWCNLQELKTVRGWQTFEMLWTFWTLFEWVTVWNSWVKKIPRPPILWIPVSAVRQFGWPSRRFGFSTWIGQFSSFVIFRGARFVLRVEAAISCVALRFLAVWRCLAAVAMYACIILHPWTLRSMRAPICTDWGRAARAMQKIGDWLVPCLCENMFYRFAQANSKEPVPSVLDHFSLHVPCSVIHTAPYTDIGNDKGMTKQQQKRQMAQRVSAGKPSRVLMALSLLLWLFARREMVKRPGKCFTECFAVLVIWNIKLRMLCKWRKWGWNLRFEKSSFETKFSRQCRKFKAHVLLTWIKKPNQLFGMSFCAKAFTDSDAEADSDVNQKWFHNMSMRYDLCEEGCHFVKLMELFFHPGHNCPEKYTLVNEATRFFDFHFGFLFGWVFPCWNSSCFFFSIFVWAGRSSKGKARLSERLSTKLCPDRFASLWCKVANEVESPMMKDRNPVTWCS